MQRRKNRKAVVTGVVAAFGLAAVTSCSRTSQTPPASQATPVAGNAERPTNPNGSNMTPDEQLKQHLQQQGGQGTAPGGTGNTPANPGTTPGGQ